MNKIRVLPDNLSNQIAAGEVVERPASVIKELVENSIDAGARRIQVLIELGGRRLMRVTDDGEGMTRDDAVLAFERHATSKIKQLEDLSRIETLGFRGEALASIASVAKVELTTNRDDAQAATRVIIEGGRLRVVKDAAHPRGTSICVRDLFFNTPARRKFMRSEATENFHLNAIITHYALAHPEIAFVLTNNGREVLRVSPARDLRERAFQIFGANLIESLLPVAGGHEYIARLRGFVSAPRERRTTRDAQYFFINGRFVRDKLLARALSEGFRSVLPHGVYPAAFLFLEVPLEEVDVNVHPAKTEVRFRRSDAVKEVIAQAIRESLGKAGFLREPAERGILEDSSFVPPPNKFQDASAEIQPKIEFAPEQSSPEPTDESQLIATETEKENHEPNFAAQIEPEINEFPRIESFSIDFEKKAQEKVSPSNEAAKKESLAASPASISIESKTRQPETTAARGYAFLPPVDSAAKLVKSIEIDGLSSSKIRPVGQLHDSFIIAVDDEGLLLVDQHVAHERILFDKFRRRVGETEARSQNLLLPETFDLTPAQTAAFELVEAELESYGFRLMRLSGRTVAIKAVPIDLPPSEARNLLAEVLDCVENEKKGGAIENLRDRIAASLACKAAVKINMPLSAEKMQWLIDRLLFTSSPTTCPHGRPVVLRLTMRDIERGFHRA